MGRGRKGKDNLEVKGREGAWVLTAAWIGAGGSRESKWFVLPGASIVVELLTICRAMKCLQFKIREKKSSRLSFWERRYNRAESSG